ncbi:MAG: hypothetical protein KF841_06430 [Phycisphaerae bacterium]|nr:hypothetical protein [Phycisphaerae bacterium]
MKPTDAIDMQFGQESVFAENLAALRAALPFTADMIAQGKPPREFSRTIGRDGTPTFRWRSVDDQVQWLGRTTTPSLRAEAIVDSFQPGSGNILFYTLGHGIDVRLLLERIAPHQAVFVVDPDPWAVAAALMLHDFSKYLTSRRLRIFVGANAWKNCGDDLVEHAGYLIPSRILSWPWFDKSTIAHVSEQLGSLQLDVTRRRRLTDTHRSPTSIASEPRTVAVAIVSTSLDARTHRLCRRIEAGAKQAKLRCECIALDSPMSANPAFAAAQLASFAPDHIVLIDTLPDTLPFALPRSRTVVIGSRSFAPTAESLESLSDDIPLLLHSASATVQRHLTDANREGTAHRFRVFRSAALPGSRTASGSAKILILADRHDVEPSTVGLHLASHVRLWEAAARLIRESVDAYHDGLADSILERAQLALQIRLDSDEVKRGIADRIRKVIGPEWVRRGYLDALREAKVEFAVSGVGWSAESTTSSGSDAPVRVVPNWSLDATSQTLSEFGAIVMINTGSELLCKFLDALNAGLLGVARVHPGIGRETQLDDLLSPRDDLATYTTRGDFVNLLKKFGDSPSHFADTRDRTTRMIQEQHHWGVRLNEALAASQDRLPDENRSSP